MTPRELPDDVEQFLRAHIRTVLQLEVLLLLQRTPGRWWSAEAVDRELRSAVDTARRHLHELVDAKLLELQSSPDPLFRFSPSRESDAATVDAIAGLFRTHFHSLVDSIYAPGRKDLREFANAFSLKKGRKDDG